MKSQLDIPALDLNDDARFMTVALREAAAAAEDGEIPIGAVIVYKAKIIGRAHNQRERLSDPTAHAEMIALTQAAAYLSSWRLCGCTMYVTLEPCAMCAGALVLARIDRLVYGPADPKAGACETLYKIVNDKRLNHQVEVVSGFMAQPCREILQDFFAAKRRKTQKPEDDGGRDGGGNVCL
jgi:tRNA(adenine34) deaminase